MKQINLFHQGLLDPGLDSHGISNQDSKFKSLVGS